MRSEAEREVAAIASLRREEGSPQRFAGSIAEAHLAGTEPDWATYLGPRPTGPAPHLRLPAQPLLDGEPGPEPQTRGNGQSDPEHPLLASLISLPAEEGWLATGRLSLPDPPLAERPRGLGPAILPGTGFLELALKAVEISQTQSVAELAIEAPLIIPTQGAVALQMQIGAEDEQGNRPLTDPLPPGLRPPLTVDPPRLGLTFP